MGKQVDVNVVSAHEEKERGLSEATLVIKVSTKDGRVFVGRLERALTQEDFKLGRQHGVLEPSHPHPTPPPPTGQSDDGTAAVDTSTHRTRKVTAAPSTNCKEGYVCACGFSTVFVDYKALARVQAEVHVDYPTLTPSEVLAVADRRIEYTADDYSEERS